jgi:GntR family transcriptional regulator, transcriptional repressor for pyruvate dehydrogenase complex
MTDLTPLTDSSQPAYNGVASKILEYIRSNRLQPGDKLPTESEMGRQMAVSRTVVREAVKVLSTVGVVRSRRGSGVYVTDAQPHPFASTAIEFTVSAEPSDVEHLFEYRLMLEPLAAAQAAERITPKELRKLEALVREYDEAAHRADSLAFRDADMSFHLCIAEATRNPLVMTSLAATRRLQNWAFDLEQGVSAVIPPSAHAQLPVAVSEHRAIFDAIHHGDPERAASAMRQHLNSSLSNYQLEVRRRLGQDLQR